jgi:transposase
MRPFGTQSQLQDRRTKAIQLLQNGYSPVEVAQKVGVDRRSVRRWKASHRHSGISGIQARVVPGRPLKLNQSKRKKLVNILLAGAARQGFDTDLWTCPRVAKVIQRKFSVRYHVDHLPKILHAMGFSPQKPERRAKERDEEAIRRWVRHDWPGIKKKRKK